MAVLPSQGAILCIGSARLLLTAQAVLAAIVVLVVYASEHCRPTEVRMSLLIPVLAEAPHEIMFFWRMRAWTDFLQMVGTFFLTLFLSIEVRRID